MTELTPRLRRRLEDDFEGHADRLAAELENLPDSIRSGQDPERIQAAVLLASQGSVQAFSEMLALARLDWRDLLVSAGLENSDHPKVMNSQLGTQTTLGAALQVVAVSRRKAVIRRK